MLDQWLLLFVYLMIMIRKNPIPISISSWLDCIWPCLVPGATKNYCVYTKAFVDKTVVLILLQVCSMRLSLSIVNTLLTLWKSRSTVPVHCGRFAISQPLTCHSFCLVGNLWAWAYSICRTLVVIAQRLSWHTPTGLHHYQYYSCPST